MSEKQLQTRLRQEAKTLLKEKRVDWVVGVQKGSLNQLTSPLITNNADDVGKLVFSPMLFSNNLAVFLTELKGRVAIMAKGCDSRSIVSLIQDNKVIRENLYIFGVPCRGIVDLGKLVNINDYNRDEISKIEYSNDKVRVTSCDNITAFPIEKLLYDHCLGCELATPKECDSLLGDAVSPPGFLKESRRQSEELAALPSKQRWQFWEKEFVKCIRCYACRSICPACYCRRCFADENRPSWITPTPIWQDNLVFQVIRNLHVAGRCTDCGECERACPVGIPLRTIARDTYDSVDNLFGFKPGVDINQEPLFTAYEVEEAEDLML